MAFAWALVWSSQGLDLRRTKKGKERLGIPWQSSG